MVKATGSYGTERYGYDSNNRRVWRKKADGTEEFTLYGAGGERVEVFRLSGTTVTTATTNVYFSGSLARTRDHASGVEKALLVDRLGSVRIQAAAQSGIQHLSYFPYGEEKGGSTANDRDKFATYSRDSSTGLDYAMNRYYGNSMGRFLTPDPFGGSPSLGRPNSWNRYAYVENDPVNHNDPSGLFLDGNAGGPGEPFGGGGGGRGDRGLTEEVVDIGDTRYSGEGYSISFLRAFNGMVFTRDVLLAFSEESFSGECLGIFEKLGTSLGSLRARASSTEFYDGTTSNTLASSLYGPAEQSYERTHPGQTIAQKFAQNPQGTAAAAQLGGSKIYLNPDLINALNLPDALATYLHELMHNVTGKVDSVIQSDLGLKVDERNTKNITDKIRKEYF